MGCEADGSAAAVATASKCVVAGLRPVLAASKLEALEAAASAWFDAQGINSISELREAETEVELATALQLKPSRKKIFLKQIAKYSSPAANAGEAAVASQTQAQGQQQLQMQQSHWNQSAVEAAAFAAVAALLAQSPPMQVRGMHPRPPLTINAPGRSSGPFLHFDNRKSSCDYDKWLRWQKTHTEERWKCNKCCFGFNHLSANLDCELRWAAYAKRQLVLNKACESDNTQGASKGTETAFTDYYDLSAHKAVSLEDALSTLSLRALVDAENPKLCPPGRCIVLRPHNKASAHDWGLGRLLDQHRNATLIIVRTGSSGQFCNYYFTCRASELASIPRSRTWPGLRFSRLVTRAGGIVLRSATVHGKTWTGVHVRRGDKLRSDIEKSQGPTSARGSPSELLGRLRPLLIGSSIFVASDERASFFASWPGAWTAGEHLKPRAGAPFRELAPFRQRPFMAAALDMYLLTRSTRFIASFSSLFSRRVASMRDSLAMAAASTTTASATSAAEDEEEQLPAAASEQPAAERALRALFWINGSVTCPSQPHPTRADPDRDGWRPDRTMDPWWWETAVFVHVEHKIHSAAACLQNRSAPK